LSDGYLTGREVLYGGPYYENNPVVVLSGCQTGLGKPFIGGTYGLARAFLTEGAAKVVGNLWNVSDTVSGRLMQRFGELMAGGEGAEYALQRVVREATEEYPDTPAY